MVTYARALPDEVVSDEVVQQLEGLASWSTWVPFADAVAAAPFVPGVYMARVGEGGPVIYVGMAGERRGKGLRDRFRVYASGKALTSGLGEAVFDRAIQDAVWLRERLAEAEREEPDERRTGDDCRSSEPTSEFDGPRSKRERKRWRWNEHASRCSPRTAYGIGRSRPAQKPLPRSVTFVGGL